jgi:metal-responsive CopG/Arc/MetJ family transcriptional regulator
MIVMASQVAKLTISLPRDLLAITDEIAAEKKISRSKVVHMCLRDLAARRLQEKMIEGYQALAKDNLKFAKQAMDIALEVID